MEGQSGGGVVGRGVLLEVELHLLAVLILFQPLFFCCFHVAIFFFSLSLMICRLGAQGQKKDRKKEKGESGRGGRKEGAEGADHSL